jgi:thiol-disulfide isomerase/thioredoxin
MKQLLIAFTMLFLYPIRANAQQNYDSFPPYLKNPTILSFQILTTNSTWFTNRSIPKNIPLAIVYFSPECGHCQYEAKELNKKMDSLPNIFFVWVSYHPFPNIKKFYYEDGLNKYKNIVAGRDPQYFIPAFYKVEITPYIALYNKQGKFVKEFRQGASPQEIMEALHLN